MTIMLVLCSCSYPENEGPFPLMENDYFWYEVDETKLSGVDSTNRKVANFETIDIINTEKEGEATISYTYQDGVKENVSFEVSKRELNEIDKNQNRKHESELKKRIRNFTNKFKRARD